jgi:hypothetical protein
MGAGSAWGSREEFLHPRDSHGRFRNTWRMPQGAADAIAKFLDSFNPKTFGSDSEAQNWVHNESRKNRLNTNAGSAIDNFVKGFSNVNANLRAGKADPQAAQMLKGAAPLPNDLILSKTVDPTAFGLEPGNIANVEELTGKLIHDPGFTSANIGTPNTPTGPGPHIQMTIATPAGTKAIIPQTSSPTSEVMLTPDQNLRVTKVTPDGKGGYYMMAVATPGEAPKEKSTPLHQAPPAPAPLDLPPKPAEAPAEPATPATPATPTPTVAPSAAPAAPSSPPSASAPRNEPNVVEALTPGGTPTPAAQPTATPSAPQAPATPAVEAPAGPVDFRQAVRDANLPSPTEGPRRKQWNNAYLGVVSGKKHPQDALRELRADIEHNKALLADDVKTNTDSGPLPNDIKAQEALANLIEEKFNLGAPKPAEAVSEAPKRRGPKAISKEQMPNKGEIRREMRARTPAPTPEQTKRSEEARALGVKSGEETAAKNAASDAAAKKTSDPWLEKAGIKESDLTDHERTGVMLMATQINDRKISRPEAARRLRGEGKNDKLARIADAITARPTKATPVAEKATPAAPATEGAIPEKATIAQLRQIAKDRGVKIPSKLTRKDDIRAHLEGGGTPSAPSKPSAEGAIPEKATIRDLRQIANDRGIKIPSKLTRKDDIRAHLENPGKVEAGKVTPESGLPAHADLDKMIADLKLDPKVVRDRKAIFDHVREEMKNDKKTPAQIGRDLEKSASTIEGSAAIRFGGHIGNPSDERKAELKVQLDAHRHEAAELRRLADKLKATRRAPGSTPAKATSVAKKAVPAKAVSKIEAPDELKRAVAKTSIADLRKQADAEGIKVPASARTKQQIVDHIAQAMAAKELERRQGGGKVGAIQADIEQAYRKIIADQDKKDGDFVGISTLRKELGDKHSREEVDRALTEFVRHGQSNGVRVIPVANTKSLTPQDRKDAVVIGDEPNHMISFKGAAPTPAKSTEAKPRLPEARQGATAADKAVSTQLKSGHKILVTKDSNGNWKPARTKTGATVLTVSGTELSGGRRGRLNVNGRDERGNDISVKDVAAHQTFFTPTLAKTSSTVNLARPNSEIVADLKGAKTRDEVKVALGDRRVSDLREIARELNVPATGKTKAEIIDSIAERTVGNKANSAAIRATNPLATKAVTSGKKLTPREISAASSSDLVKAVKAKQISKPEAIRTIETRAKFQLDTIAHRKIAVVGPTETNGSEEKQTRQIYADLLENRKLLDQLRGTKSDSEILGVFTSKPILKNHWGTPGGEINYHKDGAIGRAVEKLGVYQRMDIDGEPLANVVGKIATEGVRGEKTSREVADALSKLADRLPEGNAKKLLSDAAKELDIPDRKIAVPDSTPFPLKELAVRLSKIPLAHRTEDQVGRPVRKTPVLDSLAEILKDYANGNVRGFDLIHKIEGLHNTHHESEEGKFELDRAILEALKGLRAIGPRNLNPPKKEG